MIRALVRAAAIVLLAIPFRSGASAQVQIPDRPLCSQCSIEMELEVSLGDHDDGASLTGPPSTVRLDSSGRFWVLDGAEPPLVFDSAGAFLTSVGRAGEGPGEFRSAIDVLDVGGDSLLVLDMALGRSTVVSPELRALRTLPLDPFQVWTGAVMSWPDEVVLHGIAASAEAVGWPFHLVALRPEGLDLRRSFGPDRGESRGPNPIGLLSVLAVDPHGELWSGDRHLYRLSGWSPDGRLERSLERKPEWFAERSTRPQGGPSSPPQPRIADMRFDAEGLLWVFLHIPSPRWREAWPAGGDATGEISVRRIQADRLYTTRIEVLDLNLGRVVTQSSVDGLVVAALPGRRVAFYRETAEGLPELVVHTLHIVGR